MRTFLVLTALLSLATTSFLSSSHAVTDDDLTLLCTVGIICPDLSGDDDIGSLPFVGETGGSFVPRKCVKCVGVGTDVASAISACQDTCGSDCPGCLAEDTVLVGTDYICPALDI